MNHRLIVLGGGGHAKVLIDALKRSDTILGVCDPDPLKFNSEILGIPVLGDDKVVFAYPANSVLLVNGLGSTKSSVNRSGLFERFKSCGYRFSEVIHPSAILGLGVDLGEGTQIMAGVVVQTGSKVGQNSIINTKASVDHDCFIGQHVHIAPGSTICGGVCVGDNVHVGSGSTIIQGVRVGKNSLIGAGSLVLNDVPEGATVLGVPARVVKL